jgi:FKBP12-rapamycin complex-associated protein
MLRVLLLKANDPNSTVAANVLMCLGELTCVGGEDVNPHVPELMEIILAKLADPSIAKRDAALHALGQVCSSAGYVIQPLVEYPQLLQIFGRILKSESNSSVRREVIKVLGIIGALDPYRRKVRHIVPKQGESKFDTITQTKPDEELNESQTPAAAAINLKYTTSSASDDYYQTVVINALLGILKDQSLSSQHHTVIEAIMSIFKTQGLKCVTFLPQVRKRSMQHKSQLLNSQFA